MKPTTLISLVIILFGCSPFVQAAPADRPPNLIVIMTEDQGLRSAHISVHSRPIRA